ncbi:MAG: hypothetical protein KA248_07670 [Kiritimatiellae bacterium]|nr:hypothetical protein [Kiritimatiellia bacterium]
MTDAEKILVALRSLAAMAMGGAFSVIAYALAIRLSGASPALRRLCAAILSALWLATVLFHFLIGFGQFRLGTALASLAVLLAATLRWITPPDRLLRQWRGDWAALHGALKPVTATGWRRAGFGLALFLILLALIRALLLPPLGWDTITYHGVKSALWVQQGTADLFPAPGGWGTKAMLPGGSEIFHAWALLPFHSDLLMGFVDFACWLAFGFFLLQFCREIAAPPGAGLLGTVYLLFLPAVRMQVGSGYGEMPLMCGVMGGLIFGLRALRRKEAGSLLLCLMAFGVAAGIKTHIWPALAWVGFVLAIFVFTRRGEDLRALRPALLLGILFAGLALLPWLALNLRAGHPPLSPFPVRIGGLVLGEPTPTYTIYHHREDIEYGNLAMEWAAVKDLFQAPFSTWPHIGVLTLLLAVWGCLRLARWRTFGALAALWLAGFVGINLLVFWGPSFTVIRQLWAQVGGRFLLPALSPVVLIGTGALWGAPSLRRIGASVMLIATLLHAMVSTFFGWADFAPRTTGKTALIAALFTAAVILLFHFVRRRGRAFMIVIAGLAAASVALQKERDHLRYQALKQSRVMHWMETRWADGAQILDDPDTPRHIAITAGIDYNGDNWFLYFFLGRRFQNMLTYIPPTRSGRILDAVDWEDLARHSRAEAWLERIRRSRVTQVVSLPPWSVELEFMQGEPWLFWKAAGDGRTWGVYQIRNRDATRSAEPQ